jgi:hypothetical protein
MGKEKKGVAEREDLRTGKAEVEDFPVRNDGGIPDELEPRLVKLPINGGLVVLVPENGGAVAKSERKLTVPEGLGRKARDLGRGVGPEDENLA